MPDFVKAGGDPTKIDSLRAEDTTTLNQLERDITDICQQISFGGHIERTLALRLIQQLGSLQAYVELVSVICGYNCCARMITAFGITTDGEPQLY